MSEYAHQMWYYQLEDNFWVHPRAKNQPHSLRFSGGIAKDMYTSHSGYFGHAWPSTPKMIASTCRKLWYLPKCQK